MPELHGFQINEMVAVSSPDVVIAGALTGIGRAAARIFAQEGVHGVVSPRVGR
jgi:NAD(P)-dependent dehydrogenase (short-subunit alcohol dehydrogenase family)